MTAPTELQYTLGHRLAYALGQVPSYAPPTPCPVLTCDLPTLLLRHVQHKRGTCLCPCCAIPDTRYACSPVQRSRVLALCAFFIIKKTLSYHWNHSFSIDDDSVIDLD